MNGEIDLTWGIVGAAGFVLFLLVVLVILVRMDVEDDNEMTCDNHGGG